MRAAPLFCARQPLQPHPQPLPLPHNRFASVPFFHILYIKAISMGVQLPASTFSRLLPLKLAARSRRIRIQRQLLLPHCEKMFISSSLDVSCTPLCKVFFSPRAVSYILNNIYFFCKMLLRSNACQTSARYDIIKYIFGTCG